MTAAMHALVARQQEQAEAASVDRAVATLRALLAEPPKGHTPAPQPDAWYEAVFAEMACAHPETCTCTPEEASNA